VNGKRPLQLLVAVVLAAVAVWIAMNTYWDYEMVDNPPRGEAIHNRYYAFEHLAQRLAVHTRQVPTLRTFPAADGVLLVDDLRGALLRNRIDALDCPPAIIQHRQIAPNKRRIGSRLVLALRWMATREQYQFVVRC